MNTARMAVMVFFVGLAACVSGAPYENADRRGAASGGDAIDAYEDRDNQHLSPRRAVSGTASYFPAIAAAERSALRTESLRRQVDDARLAQRSVDRAGRAFEQAARETRHAERLDRRPVRTDPRDRVDFERRQSLFEQERAARALERAERSAGRAQDRLDLQQRADRALDSIERIDRMQRRRDARQGMPTF